MGFFYLLKISVDASAMAIFKTLEKSRQPWAGVCLRPHIFFLSMKGKILSFLHEVEKVISVICIRVICIQESEKVEFPFISRFHL